MMFMAFFCCLSMIELVGEVPVARRGFHDPSASAPEIRGTLVVRSPVSVFFRWFAVAIWNKDQRFCYEK